MKYESLAEGVALSQTTIAILYKAADLIDERGWTRGQLENEQGCLCAVGAIKNAAVLTLQEDENFIITMNSRISHARAAVCKELFEMGFSPHVSQYNDKVAKDKRYVTRLLRRTACKLEGQTK